MASITVTGPRSAVILSEQDEDGDYSWNCVSCLERAESYQPMADAIEDARIHVDIQCSR